MRSSFTIWPSHLIIPIWSSVGIERWYSCWAKIKTGKKTNSLIYFNFGLDALVIDLMDSHAMWPHANMQHKFMDFDLLGFSLDDGVGRVRQSIRGLIQDILHVKQWRMMRKTVEFCWFVFIGRIVDSNEVAMCDGFGRLCYRSLW